ncbi:ATP-dependent metallopeptidase FtsH/Yme1/Tma family protein, partial [Klebsiella pneumoniae]|uniref:ATP-dependent metallopeptidase FtsH/Yme1/Tma family protein n=1 Tax=Klebsiella pneumoniae TaxID=573 RepID=UPI003EE41635
MTVIVIFLLLMSAYALIVAGNGSKQQISLSQVANDIKAGQVTTIKVAGDTLDLTYKDGSQKMSMKDP